MLAEPGAALGQREKGTLDAALYETYRRAGITDDPHTHGRPAPVLRDLLAVLRDSDEPHGLADRLERYVDGSLGHVFSERTTAALDRPFVVFNVRDLEEELRPLATYLIADHVWGQVRSQPAAARAADRRGVVADALPRGGALPRAAGAPGAQALARPDHGDAGRRGLPGLARGPHRAREQLGAAADAAGQLDDRHRHRDLRTLLGRAGVPALAAAREKGCSSRAATTSRCASRRAPLEHELSTSSPAQLAARKEVP